MMRTHSSSALLFVCLFLGAAAGQAQGVSTNGAQPTDNSDLRSEVQILRDQLAALTQRLEVLQQKLDQKSASVVSAPAETIRSVSSTAAAPKSVAMTTSYVAPAASQTTNAHGYFERKPGSVLTFYVPGGELTTYGTLDVSVDATTKGIANEIGPDGNPPVGNMGWMPALSTNLSYIRVRGFQKLNGLPFKFIYQLETQIDIAATSGTAETNSNESNVVKGGLTSRNS